MADTPAVNPTNDETERHKTTLELTDWQGSTDGKQGEQRDGV